MSDLASRKSLLRKRILAQREQLPEVLHDQYSLVIARRLAEMPAYQQSEVVLAYMNFGTEFDSRIWVMQVLADGKRLVLPKVNRDTDQLDLYRVHDLESQLTAGLWGIAEPVPERCERLTDLNEVEFALLPGVAFARDGARLGYGGGYYDKLLMKQPAIRPSGQTALTKSLVMVRMKPHPVLVAAAFALQVVQDVPQEATDVRVEWLVTEQGIIDCSA